MKNFLKNIAFSLLVAAIALGFFLSVGNDKAAQGLLGSVIIFVLFALVLFLVIFRFFATAYVSRKNVRNKNNDLPYIAGIIFVTAIVDSIIMRTTSGGIIAIIPLFAASLICFNLSERKIFGSSASFVNAATKQVFITTNISFMFFVLLKLVLPPFIFLTFLLGGNIKAVSYFLIHLLVSFVILNIVTYCFVKFRGRFFCEDKEGLSDVSALTNVEEKSVRSISLKETLVITNLILLIFSLFSVRNLSNFFHGIGFWIILCNAFTILYWAFFLRKSKKD